MKLLYVQKVKAFAGSEKYFVDILPALEKRGVTCYFVCVYEKKHKQDVVIFIDKLKFQNIKVYEIEIASGYSILPVRKILQILKETGITKIHSHLMHADFWCSTAKYFTGNKVEIYSTKHGYEEQYLNILGLNKSFKIYFSLYYWVCRFSELNINYSFAVSIGLANFFKKVSITNKVMPVIHHGYQIVNKNESTISKNDEFIITIVGRLLKFKGHHFAIQAINNLLLKGYKLKLYIVGTGEEELTLKQIVNEMKISDNVVFAGFSDSVSTYYNKSDITLVPSTSEGFGLVILEAFSFCKPVIAFDVPACNEIIVDSFNGFLIEPYNVSQLSEKIEYLINNNEKVIEFGKNAYETLENKFSFEQMLNKLLMFYSHRL